MSTTTALDVLCECGDAKACHRFEMRWGQRVRTGCRHCGCAEFNAGNGATPRPACGPEVLTAYEAWACRGCGARYSRPYTDHECGPLTPVTVTIAVRTPEVTHG